MPTPESTEPAGRFAALLAMAYRRITGRSPSARVQAALDDFPLYAAGSVAARVLSLFAQLLVARMLGPEQFGRFSLGIGIALLLATPLQDAWGAAFVRFAAIRPAGTSPWHVLRAALLLSAASSAVVVALAAAGAPLMTRWLDVPPDVYRAGVLTSIAASVWLAARSACLGVQAWRRMVAIDLGWALLILVLPAAARVLGAIDGNVIAVFAVAYVLASAPAVPLWRRKPEHPVVPQVQPLWQFGKYLAAAAAMNSLLLYGDRLIVNHGAGLRALGVYQAYALSTMTAAVVASALVNRFLFPFLNVGDRNTFRKLFRQTLPWVAAVFLPLVTIAGALVVTLLHYPLRPAVLGVAALAGLALCAMTFLTSLVSTEGVRGPRAVLGLQTLACAIFFPIAGLLVRWLPLAAPFIAYAVALTASAALAYHWLSAEAPLQPRGLPDRS